MGFRVTGTKEVLAALKRASRTFPRAMGAALYQEGASILADSIKRTPVDVGILRSSAYLSPPASDTDPRVELGYGTSYAVYVHERLNARHPSGEAKFLERALDAAAPSLAQNLLARAAQHAKDGTGWGASTFPKHPTLGAGIAKRTGKAKKKLSARLKSERAKAKKPRRRKKL